MTTRATTRTLAESFAGMPADVIEVVPLLEWMHDHWGCTCTALDVVRVRRTDGSAGPYVRHQARCAVVQQRATACN